MIQNPDTKIVSADVAKKVEKEQRKAERAMNLFHSLESEVFVTTILLVHRCWRPRTQN